MPNLNASPDGVHWKSFRKHLREMDAMLDGKSFNLVQIAKLFQASAAAMLEGVKAQGMSSLRFSAVVVALDLKTPKSALERFTGVS